MWVIKDGSGNIVGTYSKRQKDDADHPNQVRLPDNDPDLLAFLAPRPPIDFSDVDNIEKSIKALARVLAQWNGKTQAELKAAFAVAWRNL